MGNTRSEDTLIYLAINPKSTKISKIFYGLKSFIDAKQQEDPTDRFNFITFTEKGPIYFEDFSYNGEYLLKNIKSYANQLGSQNMAGGIFLSVTFIIDTFKMVGGKTFRLLILTDSKTPKLKNIEVVQELISKVVDFPFFIDIIRISTKDPREDLKLMKFAQSTKGEIYYAKNEKVAEKVLLELADKKKIKTSGFADANQNFYIDPENEMFFENISQNVSVVMKSELSVSSRCQICGEGNNLYKCPSCGNMNHKECLAQWAKYSNIGLNNLFRCQNCFNLLKLDRDFVEMIQSGKKPTLALTKLSEGDWLSSQDSLLRENEKDELELIQGQNPFPSSLDDDGDDDDDDGFQFQDDEEVAIIWCSGCGKMLTSEFKYCNSCGNKL